MGARSRVINLNYKGVILECYGEYYKGRSGTYLDPPEDAEFKIDSIVVNGFEMIDDYEADLYEIEQLILEKI